MLTDVRGSIQGANALTSCLTQQDMTPKETCTVMNLPHLAWFYFSRSVRQSKDQGRDRRSATSPRDKVLDSSLPMQSSQEISLSPQVYSKDKKLSDFDTFFYDLNSNINTLFHLEKLIDEVYAEDADQKSLRGSVAKIFADKSPTAVSASRVDNFYQAAKRAQSNSRLAATSLEELPKHLSSKRSMVELFLKSIKNLYFVNVTVQSYSYRDSLSLWLLTVNKASSVTEQFRYFFDRSAVKEPLILIEPVMSFILNECNLLVIRLQDYC